MDMICVFVEISPRGKETGRLVETEEFAKQLGTAAGITVFGREGKRGTEAE